MGYLYAIKHGAKVIWDFDDDNSLKFWLTGAAPPDAPSLDNVMAGVSEEKVPVLELDDHKWPTYNPYPVLGAPTLPSWPRGFSGGSKEVPGFPWNPPFSKKLTTSSHNGSAAEVVTLHCNRNFAS